MRKMTRNVNKRQRKPKGQTRMDTPEKQATLGTIHRTKTQSKNKTNKHTKKQKKDKR